MGWRTSISAWSLQCWALPGHTGDDKSQTLVVRTAFIGNFLFWCAKWLFSFWKIFVHNYCLECHSRTGIVVILVSIWLLFVSRLFIYIYICCCCLCVCVCVWVVIVLCLCMCVLLFWIYVASKDLSDVFSLMYFFRISHFALCTTSLKDWWTADLGLIWSWNMFLSYVIQP